MKDFLEVLQEGDKLEPSLKSAAQRISNFEEKLSGLIELITNKPGYPQHKRAYLMKEAETTSDFPTLFGTVLERQLLAKYQAVTPDWRQYIKAGTQNDFRPQWQIGVYGLQGRLNQVKMRDEYKSDASLGDGKIVIQLSKYGRSFPLAWESLINDDLGAFSDLSDRLVTASTRTEYYNATSLVSSAAGPNTALFGAPIVHPIDGKNVTNLFTGQTFGIDTLAQACQNMRNFTDADGEPVIFDGFELVVPPALEIAMLQALNSANIIMSGGDATANTKPQIRTSMNVLPQLSITGHVNPYLPIIDTSGNANKTWYLFGKMSSGLYAARMNFLKGHETPELCMKNPNKVSLGGATMSPLEGDYESDSVWWRIRHIMGGSQVDPRYGSAYIGS